MARTTAILKSEDRTCSSISDKIRRISAWEQVPVHLLRGLALQEYSERTDADPLTGLLQRPALIETLDVQVERGEPFGLIFIGLDSFRNVNDELGHDRADRVLRGVADILRAASRYPEVVARISGAEFAVILPRVRTRPQLEQAIVRYQESLGSLGGNNGTLATRVKASMGGALFPLHSSSRPELMKHADIALAEAKRLGGDQAHSFRPQLLCFHELRTRMRSRAAECLQTPNRLIAYYQPKIDLQTGMIAGYEALLRCVDQRSHVRPPSWISAAFEDPTLATALGEHVQRQTLELAQNLHAAGEGSPIALNVTSWELQNPSWPKAYLDRANSLGIPTQFLELEITESVLLGPTARTSLRALEQLHGAGVTITLDDFGTGYASLTHLRSCPIDGLKIDRSFVRDLKNPGTGAIVRAMIELGHALGLTVIAEGVEKPEQHAWLQRFGCQHGQGYLYGAPAPAPASVISAAC